MKSALLFMLVWLLLGVFISIVLARAIRAADLVDEELARLSRPPETTAAASDAAASRAPKPPVAAHRVAAPRGHRHRRRHRREDGSGE